MTSQKPTKWNWTGQRLRAAKLLASGDMTHEQVAKECGVRRETVTLWNSVPEFLEKINELILADDRATKAGILKRAFKTLEKKSLRADEDKETELAYMKFISEVVGLTDQKAGVNIINAVGVTNSPGVKDAAQELCKRIRESMDATVTETNK